MRASLLLIAVVFSSGCAHFAPECPAHGGPPWYQIESAHFVMRTNLEHEPARKAAIEFERARMALVHSFHGVPEPGRKIEVLMLRNSMQVQDLAGANFLNGALGHDWRGPLLVLSGDAYPFGSNADLSLLINALTHYFCTFSFRRMPHWLFYGLAHYYATITIEQGTRDAVRGKMNKEALEAIQDWGALPVSALWEWASPMGQRPRLEWHREASAWFWVHYLMNQQRPAFERFLRRLEQGEDPPRAWEAELGFLGPEALMEAGQAYLREGRFNVAHFTLGEVDEALSERPLADAEVHASLSRFAASLDRWTRARDEAALALSVDSRNFSAQEAAVVTEADAGRRVAAARALTGIDEHSARGWVLLALSLGPEAAEERTAALERAVELDPEQLIALTELARSRSRAGRHPEAVALAERAVELGPFDPRVLAGAAAVFARAGQCDRAVETQQRALEVAAAPEQRARLQAGVEEYARCTAP